MGFFAAITKCGTMTDEERAAWRADYERREAESREKQRIEREALLARCPTYVLKDGTKARGRYMFGRLSNGNESDKGTRIHVVGMEDRWSCGGGGKAACGAAPGKRSVGWSDVQEDPANCPRCLAKIAS